MFLLFVAWRDIAWCGISASWCLLYLGVFGKPKGAARLGDPEACFLGQAPGPKMFLCCRRLPHQHWGAATRTLSVGRAIEYWRQAGYRVGVVRRQDLAVHRFTVLTCTKLHV